MEDDEDMDEEEDEEEDADADADAAVPATVPATAVVAADGDGDGEDEDVHVVDMRPLAAALSPQAHSGRRVLHSPSGQPGRGRARPAQPVTTPAASQPDRSPYLSSASSSSP